MRAASAATAPWALNAWSTILTTLPSTGDPVLTGGLTAYQLAATAEVVRAPYANAVSARAGSRA